MGEKVDKDLTKLFQSSDELEIPEIAKIEGAIPNWLNGGIVLRVGPGNFDFSDGFTVAHWLDGYAILSKFEILDNCVHFYKKYLQSDSYKRAIKNSRPVLVEFGTKAYPEKSKGFLQRFVSAILPLMSDNNNSNIFQLGNQFYVTSGFGCFFHAINHTSLQSGERFDTNKLFGLNGWSAHPITDSLGDTYNIGFSVFSGRFSVIKIPKTLECQNINIKENFKNATIICIIPSSYQGGISFAHSFAMTEKYIIFIEQPYTLSISSIAMAHLKGFSAKQFMKWDENEKAHFHVIEKLTGKVINTQFVSAPMFFLHVVNAFEVDDDGLDDRKIIVDLIAMNNPSMLDGMYLCKLRSNIVDNSVEQPTCRRFVLPLTFPKNLPQGKNAITNPQFSKAKAISQGENKFNLIPEILTKNGCEMPCINKNYFMKNYAYFYVSGTIAENSFSNSISKIDIHNRKIRVWKGDAHLFPGEPVFVPSPTSAIEDDGIIISIVYDVKKNHKDFMLFLRAQSMQEIARVKFESHVPNALHGIFI